MLSKHPPSQRRLSLHDAASIMVGIVVGSGIFATPSTVASLTGEAWLVLSLWIAGGIASLLGALCYAELSTRYPEHGGNYVFLSRAFGPGMGLLYAWCDFWIVRPANAGAVAIIFGEYVQHACSGWIPAQGFAVLAVLAMTLSHLAGLQFGRWIQNVMSLVKVTGLLLVVAVGFSGPSRYVSGSPSPVNALPALEAFVLVMFCFGGWSDLSNVAADVREPEQNLRRALLLGIAAITGVYVAVNAAALYALGTQRLATDEAFATHMVTDALGEQRAAWAIGGLVAISCLGSLSGVVLTGSRVYFALGLKHSWFAWLGGWNVRRATPPQSLVAQALVSCLLLMIAGGSREGFRRLVLFEAPCYWGFTALSVVALMRLRKGDHANPLAFRVPLYPATPLAFIGLCLLLIASSAYYVWQHPAAEAAYAAVVMVVGVLLALVSRPLGKDTSATQT